VRIRNSISTWVTRSNFRRGTVLTATTVVMVVASPAAAAAPSGIFNYFPDHCLDQHYGGNTPTTTVYAWTDCHLEDNQDTTVSVTGGPSSA
jgi:hypothetical protein